METYKLDRTDKEILRHLLEDARKTYTDIAKDLQVSPGTVHVRVKKMEKEINYQLIKLEQAQYQQEMEEKRESQTNTQAFDPALNNPWLEQRRYFDQLDILIKDALPLQPYYKTQTERYFKIRNNSNDQF